MKLKTAFLSKMKTKAFYISSPIIPSFSEMEYNCCIKDGGDLMSKFDSRSGCGGLGEWDNI